jgi:hypothetical protein
MLAVRLRGRLMLRHRALDLSAVNRRALATGPWYRVDDPVAIPPVLPPPPVTRGGGPRNRVTDLPRRHPRPALDSMYVASGGVAIGGAAELWVNDLEITDDEAPTVAAIAIAELKALLFDNRRAHFLLTGEWLPLPGPDLQNARAAVLRFTQCHLELVRDALGGGHVMERLVELQRNWDAFMQICQLLREDGLFDENEDADPQ